MQQMTMMLASIIARITRRNKSNFHNTILERQPKGSTTKPNLPLSIPSPLEAIRFAIMLINTRFKGNDA